MEGETAQTDEEFAASIVRNGIGARMLAGLAEQGLVLQADTANYFPNGSRDMDYVILAANEGQSDAGTTDQPEVTTPRREFYFRRDDRESDPALVYERPGADDVVVPLSVPESKVVEYALAWFHDRREKQRADERRSRVTGKAQ